MLAWDKEPSRELPLALRSAELWAQLAEELPRDFEYDRKGSIVVAETAEELAAETARAASLPLESVVLDAAGLREEEPWCAEDLPGGVLYPGDAQLEPRLATVALAEAAVAAGVRLETGSEVRRLADLRAGAVVVAAGVWTPRLVDVPVRPRKGQIVVLERSGVTFRRKLSEAGYAAAVEADEEGLMVAMVVESTPSGTTLLGSSRQHAGFDTEVELDVAAAIARAGGALLPRARARRGRCGCTPGCGRSPPTTCRSSARWRRACAWRRGTRAPASGSRRRPRSSSRTGSWGRRRPAWFSPARFG